MSITQFWFLVLRVMGILTIFSGIGIILSFINFAFLTFEGTDPVMLIALLASLLFYGFVLYAFVINPQVVIRLFRLTKQMEGQELKIEKSFDFMTRLSAIVVGGFLLVDNLPMALKSVVGYIWNDHGYVSNPDSSEFVFYLVKMGIGYVFITYSREVSGLLKKRLLDNTDTLDDSSKQDIV